MPDRPLLLLCQVGEERFALDVARVLEVTAVVPFTPVPRAPEAVAGLINYRGLIVPVLDLAMLIANRPARRFLSTRIVLLRLAAAAESGAAPAPDTTHVIGLMAERVTETIAVPAADIRPVSGETARADMYSGVFLHEQAPVLLLDPERVLPADARRFLLSLGEST